MVTMGILITILGLSAEYIWWTKDWWHPQTITGTKIGIEDALLGFSNGGIAAVLYEEVFKKRIYKYKGTNHKKAMIVFIALLFLAMNTLLYFFHFTSFIVTATGLLIISAIVIYVRRDLFLDAIITGLCMVLITIPIFLLLQYLSPGYIDHTWIWPSLSKIRFMGIPIEDITFYFLSGIFISPLYLYWKGERLRKAFVVNPPKRKRRK